MANLELGSQQSCCGDDPPAMGFEKEKDPGHHGRCKTGSPPLQTPLSQQVSHNCARAEECEAKILLTRVFFGQDLFIIVLLLYCWSSCLF